jgi:NUMOD4 motif.
MEEIWKDIPRYEGYQASNFGRIRTHNKKTYTKLHGERHWKDRILKFKPSTSSRANIVQGTGYRVSLWKDGKCKDFLVARLIATTFLEDLIETKMTVNHKNGNRLDNRVENLEWISHSDNIKYGFENDQYRQIHVKLKNKITKEVFEFRSMSLAGAFLGRNHGYISQRFNKNKKILDKNNNEYEILEIRSNRDK